jgi:hypothetical protein
MLNLNAVYVKAMSSIPGSACQILKTLLYLVENPYFRTSFNKT